MSTELLKQKVSGAKTALVVDNAFIASLLCGQRMTWDDKLDPPTMVTDGHVITMNPAHVEQLSALNMRFALANLTMRLVFNSNLRSRVGQRNPIKWDIACDIMINGLLAGRKGDDKNPGEQRDGHSTVGDMWPGAIYDWDLYIRGGRTIEGIYAILPDPTPQQEAARQGVVIFDGDETAMTEEEARMHVRVCAARDIAKAAGGLSEAMARFVDDELTPKVRWQDRLRDFFTRRSATEMSWARPSRRGLSQGILRPGKDGTGMEDILIAVDLSGSVTKEELREFLTELRAIKVDCQPNMTHVIYFASKVTRYESFAADDELDLRPDGTGGTAFSPIFRYCRDHDIEPAAAVILTDLQCADFGPAPAYPVLWTSTSSRGPTPFGEVLMLREQAL
jgi:predicted metal-dependent peptidase